MKVTFSDTVLEERNLSQRENLRCKKKCKPRMGKHASKSK